LQTPFPKLKAFLQPSAKFPPEYFAVFCNVHMFWCSYVTSSQNLTYRPKDRLICGKTASIGLHTGLNFYYFQKLLHHTVTKCIVVRT